MFYKTRRQLAKELLKDDPDEPVFADLWNMEDAFDVLQDRKDEDPTADECRELLQWMAKDHDASIGMSYDEARRIADARMPV